MVGEISKRSRVEILARSPHRRVSGRSFARVVVLMFVSIRERAFRRPRCRKVDDEEKLGGGRWKSDRSMQCRMRRREIARAPHELEAVVRSLPTNACVRLPPLYL